MPAKVSDKKYPLCSRAGVLRIISRDGYHIAVVSTAALHDYLGWHEYKRFISRMTNHTSAGISPEQVEKFLATLNGELTNG